jgi:hypothetical protein
VIAEVHPHTLPAAKVLMSEGLKYQGYVFLMLDLLKRIPLNYVQSKKVVCQRQNH